MIAYRQLRLQRWSGWHHLIRKPGLDHQRLRERAVHRAFVGDFEQARPLIAAEIAIQRNLAQDPVALDAVDYYHVMSETDDDPRQRNTLALGIHAQGHRRAGAEAGHHELKRRRPGIRAADADWLVGQQSVLASDDFLLVSSLTVLLNNDARHDRLPE